MDYYITNGGHRDLRRIYPMMQFDFEQGEVPPETMLHRALSRNVIDLLLLHRNDGLEMGYAVIQKQSLYGYVLLAFISIYPTMRGKGCGPVFLELLKSRYSHTQGILLEVTRPEGSGSKFEKLHALYAGAGYLDVDVDYMLGKEPATLMYLPIHGPREITPAAKRIVLDLYQPLVGKFDPEKYVKIRRR